eukprot:6202783-Pleurochrysis_carterae.AAC.1
MSSRLLAVLEAIDVKHEICGPSDRLSGTDFHFLELACRPSSVAQQLRQRRFFVATLAFSSSRLLRVRADTNRASASPPNGQKPL